MIMVNNKFEVYKLKRELKRSGTQFTFVRSKKNEYGEATGEQEVVLKVTGLYHESNSYVSRSFGDGTISRNMKQPQLLCLMEDLDKDTLHQGDVVQVATGTSEMLSKTLEFNGLVDIGNWGLIADLSFSEVDDGKA